MQKCETIRPYRHSSGVERWSPLLNSWFFRQRTGFFRWFFKNPRSRRNPPTGGSPPLANASATCPLGRGTPRRADTGAGAGAVLSSAS